MISLNTLSLICFFLVFILILALHPWLKNRPIQRWKKSLSIDQHQNFFQKIYTDIDGFSLSQEARKEGDAIEYTYGEIDFESFVALLSLTHPNKSTVFYDLGSGVGKAVVACAIVFPIKKSCGIEIFPSLHECALAQKKRLQSFSEYRQAAKTIEFQLEDILKARFDDANLIFINSTAFFGDHWMAISKHLEQVKAKTKVITTTKTIRSNLFQVLSTTEVKMSWGVVKAFIQEKL